MNMASSPSLTEQIEHTQQKYDAYAAAAAYLEKEAAEAANRAQKAQLHRSAVAAQAAAAGVNAAVTLIDSVAMTGAKDRHGRAFTHATHYDLGAAGDEIRRRSDHATRNEIAPAWRQVLGESDSEVAIQNNEYESRMYPDQLGEPRRIQDSGVIVGPVTRAIRRLVNRARDNRARNNADMLAQTRPHSGTLLPKLDPDLLEPSARSNGPVVRTISGAVAVATDHLQHYVDYATDPKITDSQYWARLRGSTPGNIRARVQVSHGDLPSLTGPDGYQIDGEEVTEEYLHHEDRLLAKEGALAFKAAFGLQATPKETTDIQRELYRISRRLAAPTIRYDEMRTLQDRRNMLLALTGQRTATPQELVSYRDYFVAVASSQLGTMAMRHAVRDVTGYASLMAEAHGINGQGGLRAQRRTIQERISQSQLPGFTPPGFDPTKDRRLQIMIYRQGLRDQLQGLHARLEAIGKTTITLAKPQGAVLPAERTLIPDIVDATFDERSTRHIISDQTGRARRAQAQQQQRAAEAAQARFNRDRAAAHPNNLRNHQPRP